MSKFEVFRPIAAAAAVFAVAALTVAPVSAAQPVPADWANNLSSFVPRDPDFQPISQFPGTVLAPTQGAHFFDGFQLYDASFLPESTTTTPTGHPETEPEFYQWSLTTGSTGTMASPSIGLRGSMGRQSFAAASATPYDCTPAETYCAYAAWHDAGFADPSTYSPSDAPTAEKFWGLTVNGNAAVVTYFRCCNGQSWAIDWYDPSVDQSFDLGVEYDVATAPIAATLPGVPSGDNLDPSDRAFANKLAAVASALVPVQTTVHNGGAPGMFPPDWTP